MEIRHRRLAKQFIGIQNTTGKMGKLFPNKLIESTRDCDFLSAHVDMRTRRRSELSFMNKLDVRGSILYQFRL